MYIEKKTMTIVGMAALACLLILANYLSTPAKADFSLKDRDFQLITAKASQGGESLYIMDNRTGLIGVFMYDPNARRVQLRGFQSVPAIFAGQ